MNRRGNSPENSRYNIYAKTAKQFSEVILLNFDLFVKQTKNIWVMLKYRLKLRDENISRIG